MSSHPSSTSGRGRAHAGLAATSESAGESSRPWMPGSTLKGALREILDRHVDPVAGRLPQLDRPNMPAARESVALFRECFHSLSAQVQLATAAARAFELEVDALYRSFDAFIAFRAGETALTSSLLLEVWSSRVLAELGSPEAPNAEILGFARSLYREVASEQIHLVESVSAAAAELAATGDYTEWLVVYQQAVEQIAAPELGARQARTALRSLMTRLELSQDDLGRMFGVSGETIRRWERGSTAVPAERRSDVLTAESGLRRLQDLFRPERLPTVVRRPAELFDGETALEWILRGRVAEVADRYEAALLYQA